MRVVSIVSGVALLAACADSPVARVAPPAPGATPQTMYVAAQRDFDDPGPAFGKKRPKKLSYARVTVSVPPTHKVGKITWPDETPSAATDFVITGSQRYDNAEAMRRALRAQQGAGETQLFVHGYNNTMSEALYRYAQIKTDFNVTEPAVLFSWASAGDPRGYVYDRDSVLVARDGLESTLRLLTRGDEDVFILAHSMGAHLTMETLRQIAIRGDRDLLSKVSGVALMSPDIDPDVFRSQAEAIGDLPQPFVIFISREDRALGLASLITGRKPRLGDIRNPAQVRGLDVSIIDVTALGDGEGFNHATPVTSEAAVRVLRGMIETARRGAGAFADYLVLSAQQ